MKKLFFVTFLLFAMMLSASAQLKIKNTNATSERFYKDTWATVTWNGSAFMLNSSDPKTGLTLSFSLGDDRDTAIATLQQILDWFTTADKKSSITFEDNGKDITLYKQDNLQIIISDGDAEYIRKEFSQRMLGATVGVSQYAHKESTPHFSYIQKKALVQSIDALSALTDEKYIKKPVEETANQNVNAEIPGTPLQ